MIEDKATEKWKERAKKLGLIVNMGADEPKPKQKAPTEKTDRKRKPREPTKAERQLKTLS